MGELSLKIDILYFFNFFVLIMCGFLEFELPPRYERTLAKTIDVETCWDNSLYSLRYNLSHPDLLINIYTNTKLNGNRPIS